MKSKSKLLSRLIDVANSISSHDATVSVVVSSTGSITIYSLSFSKRIIKSLITVLNDFNCSWSLFPLSVDGYPVVAVNVVPF